MRGSLPARMCSAALFAACVVLCATAAAPAEGLELPVAGVYEQDLVTGEVELPGTLGSGDTVLRVTGSLVPGTVQYGTRKGRRLVDVLPE